MKVIPNPPRSYRVARRLAGLPILGRPFLLYAVRRDIDWICEGGRPGA